MGPRDLPTKVNSPVDGGGSHPPTSLAEFDRQLRSVLHDAGELLPSPRSLETAVRVTSACPVVSHAVIALWSQTCLRCLYPSVICTFGWMLTSFPSN